ncbi:MAG: hypothetical protein WEB52_09325 [Dehalococcoidia bacterium]
MREAFSLKRLAIAVVIAGAIYGLAVGIGSALYATDNMPTGATHNDCADYRREIADEQGIDRTDVPQEEIKQRTETCLEGHVLTENEAFRSEYLFWSIWPGVICAVVFLIWPVWTRILLNQEAHDDGEGGGKHHTPERA